MAKTERIVPWHVWDEIARHVTPEISADHDRLDCGSVVLLRSRPTEANCDHPEDQRRLMTTTTLNDGAVERIYECATCMKPMGAV